MTREEAIWYLQPIADSASLERYKEALGMAISALREQEERSKGCEYCQGAAFGDILVSRRAGDTITYKHRALCCPECGRRLEEV